MHPSSRAIAALFFSVPFSSLSIAAEQQGVLFEPVHDGEMTIGVASSGGTCDECQWIQIEGAIPITAGETFERYLGGDHTGAVVYLNSPGGKLVGAMALGRAIRKHGFPTAVGKTVSASDNIGAWIGSVDPGKCLSACAYAFLGGTTRTAAGGEIGVHRFYDPKALASATDPIFSAQDMAEEQELLSEALRYVAEMGASSKFLVAASNTPSSAVYYFSDQELSEFAISLDVDTVKDWRIQAQGGGLIL
jgi:hypothetical protein